MSKEDALKIALVIMGLVIAAILVMFVFLQEQEIERTQIIINDHVLDVYIAQTSAEHAQGLSGIDLSEFDADGMLFIFEDPIERTFWMKDMEFAIDIVWIRDSEIVEIEEGLSVPNNQDILYMYSDPYKVDAALELPAGDVDKYGIDLNQKVSF